MSHNQKYLHHRIILTWYIFFPRHLMVSSKRAEHGTNFFMDFFSPWNLKQLWSITVCTVWKWENSALLLVVYVDALEIVGNCKRSISFIVQETTSWGSSESKRWKASLNHNRRNKWIHQNLSCIQDFGNHQLLWYGTLRTIFYSFAIGYRPEWYGEGAWKYSLQWYRCHPI